jgi:ribosome recycling factor
MNTIILQEGVVAPLEKYMQEEMIKCLKHFEHELTGIRSGRAHPSMVESIKISCYGGESELPLKNLASVSTPDARTIMIQPWDTATIPDIERGIKESDTGFTPVNDGNIIRISLPEMSNDVRDKLVKQLGKKLEESRVSIRNVRKNIQNFIRDEEKKKNASEDFAKRLNDLLQKHTDDYIKKVDLLAQKKEQDLKS